MTIPRILARAALFAGALASARAADGDLKPVFVGVGERVLSFQKPNQRIVPTPSEPQFYLAEHVFPATKPPEWIAQWVTTDLSTRGFVPSDPKLPALWLVFEWGSVDPDITHIGRPLQKLDPRGRRIYDWKETKYERGEATPFCVVTAHDISDFQKPAGARTPLWRAEMWTVFVRPFPQTKVEVGPLVFKEYGTGASPKPTPATEPSPAR